MRHVARLERLRAQHESYAMFSDAHLYYLQQILIEKFIGSYNAVELRSA